MTTIDSLSNLEKEIREETIRAMTRELNHLINSGLLVVNEYSGTFVYNPITSGVSYYPKIIIELRDQDYIKKLEIENQTLKRALDDLQTM